MFSYQAKEEKEEDEEGEHRHHEEKKLSPGEAAYEAQPRPLHPDTTSTPRLPQQQQHHLLTLPSSEPPVIGLRDI